LPKKQLKSCPIDIFCRYEIINTRILTIIVIMEENMKKQLLLLATLTLGLSFQKTHALEGLQSLAQGFSLIAAPATDNPGSDILLGAGLIAGGIALNYNTPVTENMTTAEQTKRFCGYASIGAGTLLIARQVIACGMIFSVLRGI
jgi:hypothetical protein